VRAVSPPRQRRSHRFRRWTRPFPPLPRERGVRARPTRPGRRAQRRAVGERKTRGPPGPTECRCDESVQASRALVAGQCAPGRLRTRAALAGGSPPGVRGAACRVLHRVDSCRPPRGSAARPGSRDPGSASTHPDGRGFE
jgi:hypothetical protein